MSGFVSKWNHWSSKASSAALKPIEPVRTYSENGVEIKVYEPNYADEYRAQGVGRPRLIREGSAS